MTIKEQALMLTAYETVGTVGKEEAIQFFCDEILDRNELEISDYNTYLEENGNEEYMTFDYFHDERLAYMSPSEAFRLAYSSDISINDDYFRYNGYGNLESYTECHVYKEMCKDADFLKWYVEENDMIDWDEMNQVITMSNELISQGY